MLFGTAGVPNSSKDRSTLGGIRRIRELNLDCMEVQFVRGVKMGEKKAIEVGKLAKSLNVVLSVHAPYYVNLNAESEIKVRQSIQRLFDSVRIGVLLNARNIVFHAGYYMKYSKETAYRRIKEALERLVGMIEHDVVLRVETMGKRNQFGDIDEVVRLSEEVDKVMPCIDISHIHARTRAFNSYDEFADLLELIENRLGRESLKDMHIHISGIEYDLKGEKRHVNLKESDFNYIEFLRALKDFGADGRVISESPNLEEDALMLKNLYSTLH